MSKNPVDDLPAFDAELSQTNVGNQKAATARKLIYDTKSRSYKDEDGCLVRDKFGQPL